MHNSIPIHLPTRLDYSRPIWFDDYWWSYLELFGIWFPSTLQAGLLPDWTNSNQTTTLNRLLVTFKGVFCNSDLNPSFLDTATCRREKEEWPCHAGTGIRSFKLKPEQLQKSLVFCAGVTCLCMLWANFLFCLPACFYDKLYPKCEPSILWC